MFDTIALSFKFLYCLPFQSCPLLSFTGTKQSTLFHYLHWVTGNPPLY